MKNLLNRHAINLIGESFAAVVPGFDEKKFRREAMKNLEPLGLLQRGAHISKALGAQLPDDFEIAAPLLIASFGPPLVATEGNGLAPFFYLPHTYLVATRGVTCFASGMRVNHELTRRFSAEFSIRPFLIQHQAPCLKMLTAWTADPDPHVRRLLSEGTRPRLPWAVRLPVFQRDPSPVLPLLQRLRDDPSLYVRRSVANHLGDIAKDLPREAFDICWRWLDEVAGSQVNPDRAQARRWMVRHAVRLTAKKGSAEAARIRRAAR